VGPPEGHLTKPLLKLGSVRSSCWRACLVKFWKVLFWKAALLVFGPIMYWWMALFLPWCCYWMLWGSCQPISLTCLFPFERQSCLPAYWPLFPKLILSTHLLRVHASLSFRSLIKTLNRIQHCFWFLNNYC